MTAAWQAIMTDALDWAGHLASDLSPVVAVLVGIGVLGAVLLIIRQMVRG